ncbi:MAG: hypothetical protein Q4B22_09160 [Eubacteriales bacterium]|nr:hypothetical protein [Eubacteriales bacterium]
MSYNRKEEIIENLRDAGCSEEAICCFLDDFCSGNKKVSAARLREHRKELLNEMHSSQRKIDCLDYFLYLLEKGEVTINEKTV